MTTSVSRPTTSRVVSHARRRHRTRPPYDTGPGATPFRESFCPCPSAKHRLEKKNDREGRSGRAGGGGGFSRDKKGRKFWAYASKESRSLSERAAISLSLCTLCLYLYVLNCNYARRRVGIDHLIGNLFCDPYPGDSDPATISTRPAILRETRRQTTRVLTIPDT